MALRLTVALCLLSFSAHSQSAKEKKIIETAAAESKLPRLVMILRHGEKSGDERDPDLTPVGRQRATLLPNLFIGTAGNPPRFAHPDALFATTPSKKSNRPAETIAPLGTALREKVNLDFGKDDEEAMVREILDGHYAGKVVLIIWHHKAIPPLARDFGITDPPKWADEVFDRVWEITYPNGVAHLSNLPELLLPGDSK